MADDKKLTMQTIAERMDAKRLAEPGQRVRGIIVCRTMSEDLRLACASASAMSSSSSTSCRSPSRVAALELPT